MNDSDNGTVFAPIAVRGDDPDAESGRFDFQAARGAVLDEFQKLRGDSVIVDLRGWWPTLEQLLQGKE